ncbi:MAG: glycerophosphodiester phosphodiesterase [Rhodobacteraceae bacterium]|nr:glycerophosphodiester phosphodiesterase [Paracoccaceae bacterium]
MSNQPKIFGHRGAPHVLPENTLASFDHAIAVGADGLELDVLMTRDGIPVVTHNPRLMADTTRGPDGAWLNEDGPAIRDLTLEELRRYDVGGIRPGSDYAARFPDQMMLEPTSVPTLAEVLALVAAAPRRIDLLVELKHAPKTDTPQAPLDVFVGAVVADLTAFRLVEQSWLHAFNWAVLEEGARQCPELRRSHLSIAQGHFPFATFKAGSDWLGGIEWNEDLPAVFRGLKTCGAAVWSPYHKDASPEAITAAQSNGLDVMVWTVNEPETLRRMINAGVEGMITDDPATALGLRDGQHAKQDVVA